MKRLFSLFLIPVFALSSVSCSTTGTADAGAVVNIAVSYGIAKHLAGAKTLEQFQSRQADLAAVAAVLKTVNSGTVDQAALRALLSSKFGNKPEVMLLATIVLTYYQPAGGGVNNAYLTQVIAQLEAASTQPAPVF